MTHPSHIEHRTRLLHIVVWAPFYFYLCGCITLMSQNFHLDQRGYSETGKRWNVTWSNYEGRRRYRYMHIVYRLIMWYSLNSVDVMRLVLWIRSEVLFPLDIVRQYDIWVIIRHPISQCSRLNRHHHRRYIQLHPTSKDLYHDNPVPDTMN